MGAKAKKALQEKWKRNSSLSQLSNKAEAADFLPIEGGPGHKLPEQTELKNKSGVLYIGRIPHGFYEKEMEAFFSQFGKIKRLRIARNKKTGKSKHFGFIEFEDPEVAEIVADCMHNYLLFEHLLQVYVIPSEQVHPRLWRGFNYRCKPLDGVQVERKQLNKICNRHKKRKFGDRRVFAERTLGEQKKLVDRIMKRNHKRQKMIEAAGIDYECPEIVGDIHPAPKRIKFDED